MMKNSTTQSAEIVSIYTFITKKGSQNKATQFIRELESRIASLSEMPLRCRKSFYSDDELTRDLKSLLKQKIVHDTV